MQAGLDGDEREQDVTPSRMLLLAVEEAFPRLNALTEAESARPAAPGRWTPRQEMGHLVDSALVNCARVARAVGRADLVFEGYDQDRWSALFGDGDAPWAETVALWAALNRRFARALARVPADELARPHSEHNLERIAWRRLPDGQPATLGWLAEDYVGHLEHHLSRTLEGKKD